MQGATAQRITNYIFKNCFNPRPYARGDITYRYFSELEMFQSTPLCKGRLNMSSIKPLDEEFQSTPLCKGRQHTIPEWLVKYKFQSTPLCKGRRENAGI